MFSKLLLLLLLERCCFVLVLKRRVASTVEISLLLQSPLCKQRKLHCRMFPPTLCNRASESYKGESIEKSLENPLPSLYASCDRLWGSQCLVLQCKTVSFPLTCMDTAAAAIESVVYSKTVCHKCATIEACLCVKLVCFAFTWGKKLEVCR